MSPYKPNAPWLTEMFVEIAVSGLVDVRRLVAGSATVPAHRAAEVGRALVRTDRAGLG